MSFHQQTKQHGEGRGLGGGNCHCRIEAKLHRGAKIEAARRGISMRAVIETALREHLQDRTAQSVAGAT